MTRLSELVGVLKASMITGISMDDICKSMQLNRKTIYPMMSNIRSILGMPIKYDPVKKLYFISETIMPISTPDVPAQKRKYNRRIPTSWQKSKIDLPFPLPNGIVPDGEKDRFIDLIVQSSYLYRCAEALIETGKLKQQLGI